jgi:hypothetical protein
MRSAWRRARNRHFTTEVKRDELWAYLLEHIDDPSLTPNTPLAPLAYHGDELRVSDEQAAVLLKDLRYIVENEPYPFSLRIPILRAAQDRHDRRLSTTRS